MKTLTSAAIAAVLIATVPAVGSAQDLASNFKRDQNTSVRQRPRPDYEAVGLKTGGFTLYPRVTVEATHDDNIYAVASGEQSDTIWRVKPEVAARSNWSRNALGAFASASINRYSDFDTENTEEYTLGVNGRLDVERGSYISASVQWQQLTEPRTSITAGTLAGATPKPVEYSLWSGNVTGVKEFNRLRLTGKLDSKKFDYDDQGGVVRSEHRDRDEFYYGGKAEYAVSPDTAVFASLTGNTREYDVDFLGRAASPGVPAQPALRARDSDGYVATVGANFDVSQSVRGEIEAGYMSQSYDQLRRHRRLHRQGSRRMVPDRTDDPERFGFALDRRIGGDGFAGLHLEQCLGRHRSRAAPQRPAVGPGQLRQGQLRDHRSRRQAYGLQRLGRLSAEPQCGPVPDLQLL
jgi:hypothetical protein